MRDPDKPEDREPREVHGGCKKREVLRHSETTSDAGSSSAVPASHEMSDLAFNLGPRLSVDSFPGRIALVDSGALKSGVLTMYVEGPPRE